MWNRPPGHLQIHNHFSLYARDYPQAGASALPLMNAPLSPSPMFTAVITVTHPALRDSAPLMRLIKELAEAAHLKGIVLLWTGLGPPQV